VKHKLIGLICLVLLPAVTLGCPPQTQPPEVIAPEETPQVEQEVVEEPEVIEEPEIQEPAPHVIKVTVTRIVDGDTIHVVLDGVTETVRIIGVDTPETVHPDKPVEPFGPEATEFAREMLDGKQVWLEMDVQERCRFGRLLAYVWIQQPLSGNESEVRAKMFNAKLLLSGYAQCFIFPPNVKYVDMFTTFQQEAREANRGLWGKEEKP